MKRYIKNANIIIDTDTDIVTSITLPYVIEISINLSEDLNISASQEASIYLQDDIFAYPEYLQWFAEQVGERLETKYNVSVAKLKVNRMHNSVYLPAVERVQNSLIKLKAEFGYLLRIGNHPQRIPYSEEVEQSRVEAKKRLVEFIQTLFSRTKQQKNDLHIEFPEIDYSITVKVSQDANDNVVVYTIDEAIEFIAKDMYNYIQREAANLSS